MENLYITTLTNPPTADDLLRAMHLPDEAEPEELDEARTLAEAAIAVAHPKAVLRPIAVTKHSTDTVTLDGVRIDCALMAENLRNIHRVFGYVCTCGQELEAWSQTLSDPLEAFWADTIKLRYVTAIQRELFSTVREKFLPEGYLSHMNPGSLPEWPLTAQRELFALLTGGAAEIGVTLTDSCLMLPAKSTSGILFTSEVHFENCRLCTLPHCPNRRN